MFKKIVISFLIIAFLAMAGGGFYWWQANQAVAGLNKSLPSGVKVVKSLFRRDYTVVNKIDGYEFKVPKAWGGIEEIEHVPERTEGDYTAASISVKGKDGWSRLVTIDRFKVDKLKDLESWAKINFESFGLTGDFSKDKIGYLEIVKSQENIHLGGMYVYFFEGDLSVYAITNGSEEFIQEIILNGKW